MASMTTVISLVTSIGMPYHGVACKRLALRRTRNDSRQELEYHRLVDQAST